MSANRIDASTVSTLLAAPRAVTAVLAAFVLAGCMTAKVDETRRTTASVQANESIVLLKRPQLEGVGTEEVFIDCLQNRLGGQILHPAQGQDAGPARAAKAGSVPFRIYGEKQFIDAMFPWFEASTAPPNPAALKLLLQRPGVTERLEQIGVRYVVWVDGITRKTDSSGSMACAIGPMGGGCIGLGWWDKQSGYVASVWDLNTATEIGSVSADVTGTSVMIGALVPIPIITPVRRTACDRLGDQLHDFLVGSDLLQPAGAAKPAAAGGKSAGTR